MDLAGLRCPHCRDGWLSDTAAGTACSRCGRAVPIEQGVPLLVRDWAPLREQVEAAAQVRPQWYLEEQPPEQSSPWRHHLRKRRSYVQQAIRAHLQRRREARAARLLDLGCGDGNHLTWLSAFAERAYGSDYNLVRLVRAQAQNPEATIFAADVLDFPAEDGAFDVVFFNHVIEHIPDDVAALREVRRVLKPGGLLVLGTPNEGSWWWQLAYRRDPQSLATTDHVHFYTGDSIGARMRQAGLTLIETHYLGWGPPDWRLDGRIRKFKLVDDVLALVGRTLIPRQASSLYLLATRQ
jgi:2-polyprenyl-3-methyl-5-hydroxy-6-metoxy-1,4-benzoquinol methylase